MTYSSIESLSYEGRVVLLRVDYNVPLSEDGNIQEDTRLQASLPSLRYLLKEGAKVVIASHLGRPKGKVVEKWSLKVCFQWLEKQLPLSFCQDLKKLPKQVAQLKKGEALLMENLRFFPGEESNDGDFASFFQEFIDILVNDAFSCAHRFHSINYDLAKLLGKGRVALGKNMLLELEAFDKLQSPQTPFCLLLGGGKIRTKLPFLKAMLPSLDKLLLGGALAHNFLLASGISMGSSYFEASFIEEAKEIIAICQKEGVELYLPLDVKIQTSKGTGVKSLESEGLKEGEVAGDIGPQTLALYQRILDTGSTIFWNGPLGKYEEEPFKESSEKMAYFLATHRGYRVVGGGDTVAILGLNACYFDHVSTGGGAALQLLEKKYFETLKPYEL